MMSASHMNAALGDLIDVAVTVINNGSGERMTRIVDLTERIEALRAQQIEGGNPVGAETSMLLEALGEIEQRRMTGEVATDWSMVAGVLLPMVRVTALNVLALGARRPSTSDHDFARRR